MYFFGSFESLGLNFPCFNNPFSNAKTRLRKLVVGDFIKGNRRNPQYGGRYDLIVALKILLIYRCISCGEEDSGLLGSTKNPEGLGFILATNIKLQGYVTVNLALEMVTSRSSMGCLITLLGLLF